MSRKAVRRILVAALGLATGTALGLVGAALLPKGEEISETPEPPRLEFPTIPSAPSPRGEKGKEARPPAPLQAQGTPAPRPGEAKRGEARGKGEGGRRASPLGVPLPSQEAPRLQDPFRPIDLRLEAALDETPPPAPQPAPPLPPPPSAEKPLLPPPPLEGETSPKAPAKTSGADRKPSPAPRPALLLPRPQAGAEAKRALPEGKPFPLLPQGVVQEPGAENPSQAKPPEPKEKPPFPYRLEAVFLGPVSVGVFVDGEGRYLAVPVGSPLGNTGFVVRQLFPDRAVLVRGDEVLEVLSESREVEP